MISTQVFNLPLTFQLAVHFHSSSIKSHICNINDTTKTEHAHLVCNDNCYYISIDHQFHSSVSNSNNKLVSLLCDSHNADYHDVRGQWLIGLPRNESQPIWMLVLLLQFLPRDARSASAVLLS